MICEPEEDFAFQGNTVIAEGVVRVEVNVGDRRARSFQLAG